MYLSFSFWFTSLSTIISRSIHVAANGIMSFFFMAESVFHCIYVPHLLYPFCPWTFRFHLGCFHVLAVVNSAMNIGVHVCFLDSFRLDICPGVRLLDHMVNLVLVFWGTSIVAAPTYIPTNSVGGFPFLPTLSSICYF